MSIRTYRVKAFCEWLDTIPPNPPFYTRPAFKFFADLTDLEMYAAQQEMIRRAAEATAEADALEKQIESQIGEVDY